LNWDGKIETSSQIFLQIAMGELSIWGIAKKVLTRKIKLRGIRNLLQLLKIFKMLLSEENQNKAN